METRWLSQDEQRAWRAYLDATRLLLQDLDRQLSRDANVTLTDFELLVHLSEAPDRRLRMSELAERVTTTRSGVTRAVSRLVEAGWVVRLPCQDDKRGMLAELTPAGAEKLAAISPGHVETVRRNVFDLLDSDEVAGLVTVFDRIRHRLSESA